MDKIILQDIWNEILKTLENYIAKPAFETWIRKIKLANIEDDVVTIEVPNILTKNFIQEKYLKIIKESISNSLKRDVVVDFIVVEKTEGAKILKPRAPQPQPEKRTHYLTLNPKYTFDNFVVGDSNKLSHAGAFAVARAPGKSYNPLFIYGGVGLGKTHLLQAIGHYVIENHKGLKVLYVTCETFGNELIAAIQNNKIEDFRSHYRTIDMLLIDDIQFIIGREKTQTEFFHTFNTLFEANKQIVITSDRPVREFVDLEERLRSRMGWGLIVDIQPPDVETRIAILQKKFLNETIHIPDKIIYLLAEQFTSNIREMEGALNKIIAMVDFEKKEVTEDFIKEILKDTLPLFNKKILTLDKIKEVVSNYFNINISDLTSQRRLKNITYPRQIAMYIARESTNNSFIKIGEEFGNRDHTTVLYSYEKIQKEIKENPETKKIIEEIYELIKKM